VLVIDDNCVDRTEEKASAAGAEVIVRNDRQLQGKGHALTFAFDYCLARDFADAVVVIDADTVVSRNLLSAFATHFERGATALQAEYGVRNPQASWRTRLMTIALSAFHGVRSISRDRLGLSCGLRGNGMAFSRTVLQAHPYRGVSIVEDVEYGLQLGYAGIRVQYVHEAAVFGNMVASERASRSQRRRWEHGRRALVTPYVPRLLQEAWCRRSLLLLDLAVDLLVPPVAQLAAVIAVGVGVCAGLALMIGGISAALYVWVGACCGLMLYVGRGWRLSNVGVQGLFDLLWAPAYVIWKLTLSLKDDGRLRAGEWIRTAREAGK
jgi:1,2-diacylglycerol 3-beta-glucosyltransferase